MDGNGETSWVQYPANEQCFLAKANQAASTKAPHAVKDLALPKISSIFFRQRRKSC
jgi:hypothetical protein